MIQLKTIDAHAGGQPLRLLVDGFPSPRGRSMIDKREWVRKHADRLRHILMLEPRGHSDMCGALLTEPVTPGSHAGVIFMDASGYRGMSAHSIVAATTIALERGLLMPGGDGSAVVFDAPAGVVRAHAVLERDAAGAVRVTGVRFLNVPSFVLSGGLPVTLGARQIRADVAFGGGYYAIVDAEAAGLPLEGSYLPEFRRAGVVIARAVGASQTIVHPADARVHDIDGTVFTGPPRDESADLRSVTVFADGSVDRSACGTATAAVMAVIDAMGLLAPERPFVHESVVGTRLSGRLASRTTVGDYAAIVPEIEGSAWITGEHTFLVHDDDPLAEGFKI